MPTESASIFVACSCCCCNPSQQDAHWSLANPCCKGSKTRTWTHKPVHMLMMDDLSTGKHNEMCSKGFSLLIQDWTVHVYLHSRCVLLVRVQPSLVLRFAPNVAQMRVPAFPFFLGAKGGCWGCWFTARVYTCIAWCAIGHKGWFRKQTHSARPFYPSLLPSCSWLWLKAFLWS